MPKESQALDMLKTIVRVIHNYYLDDGTFLANAIAFSAAFSIFPLLLLAAAVFGFIIETPQMQIAVLDFFATNAPLALQFVSKNIDHFIAARGSVGFIATGALLIAGISVFTTLETALNAVFKTETRRHILIQKLFAMLVIILAAALALTSIGLSLTLSYLRNFLAEYFSLSQTNAYTVWQWIWSFAAHGIGLIVAFVMFIIIYRLVPNYPLSFAEMWPGAALAGLTWELSKLIVGYLVANIVRYSVVYGSLGSGIVFLTWMYLTAISLIFGAELIKVRLDN